MKNKKGISDLIGWVLLIGFTITIAAFVTTWVIDQTKKTTTSFDEGIKVYCPDVVLSIEEITITSGSGVTCNTDEINNILTLDLKNKGKFTIWELKGLGVDDIDYTFIDPEKGLIPGDTISNVKVSFCRAENNNEIEIVPEIEVEGKKGYCSESSLVINDEILKNIEYTAP